MNSENKIWHSSYEQNNYGDFFYSLIQIYKPEKVVELGTLTGYSAYHMARAMRENDKGSIDCYDLWENNVNNFGQSHISKSAAEQNLKQCNDIVTLYQCEAVGIEKKYDTVDVLHVDLDNDGDILEKVIPAWIDRVKQCIIIEGGSSERDELASRTDRKKLSAGAWLNDLEGSGGESLKKIFSDSTRNGEPFVVVSGEERYKEKPIREWLENFSRERGDIEYFTIEQFPSLTIIRKKQ